MHRRLGPIAPGLHDVAPCYTVGVAWTVGLGVEDLANTRFSVSPLHETITALYLLRSPDLQPLHEPWCRWAERELAARPVRLPLLWQLVGHDLPSWPEFLAPAPPDRRAGLAQQLAAVRATDPESVRASLRRVFGDDPPEAAVRLSTRPAGTLAELAEELRTAHDRLIGPHWPRMQALLDVDIAYRAGLLASGGPAGLLATLHPAVRWRNGVLTVDQGSRPRAISLARGGLVLCPSVFGGPHVVMKGHTSSRTTLRYPARGVGSLWSASTAAPPDGLVRLVGRPRARLLSALRSPATTTVLAREQDVTPSAVSQQLGVLHANGLVRRDRAGRRVQYSLTETGRALVGAPPGG
jgi:DNA-binding transcriptional ArsR family regulator